MDRSLSIAALLASLIAGCSCGGPALRPCTSSRDCRIGTVCSSGRCVPHMDGTVEDDSGPYDAGAVLDAIPFDGAACAIASDVVATQPVDIIVVVDQSASTGEERDAIEANISTNLVSVLEANHVDYHVILINSDPALCPDPPLRIEGSDCMSSNLPRYLRVPHPVNNSDELTLILWTYVGDGKRPNSCVRNTGVVPAWRDAVRPGALKVFIVFSDDDPTSYRASGAPPSCSAPGGPGFAGCSSATCPNLDCDAIDWGTVCPNFGCPTFDTGAADWNGGRDFLTELQALDPPGMFGGPDDPLVIFHSIIGVSRTLEPTEPITDRCDRCDFSGNTAENSGVTYQALSRTTGGLRFPSCNTDYSTVFERISETLRPLACDFLIEQTGPDPIDPSLVNVTFDPGDGSASSLIVQDAHRGCDAGADGWQWNADFTRIRLCGPACDRVSASEAGTVSITVGCDTVMAPF
jgi:hypothetical protein